MTMRIITGILASIIAFSSCNRGQIHTKEELYFGEDVENWLNEYNVPAVGIGIIEDGEIKYTAVFGELKKDVPAPENTIFNIASLTKPIVAMLTLKLVEAGQWDLDEPLFHYWIDPDISNDTLLNLLTTRHVLSHQTGFVNWRRMNPSGELSFEFVPGTDYKYSGEGFEYLRRAIENKFEKTLAQLSDSVLFMPLGMNDTRFYWDDNMDESRFAYWHNYKGNLYNPASSKTSSTNAAGSILTTVEDYCKFGVDILNGAGLSSDLFKEMISTEVKLVNHFEMGLCWEIVRDMPEGEYALVHGGTDNGVNTVCIFLPESKRGIIVFTNGDNGSSIAEKLIKKSFGETIYDNIFKIDNIPEICHVSNVILVTFTGDYKDQYGRDLNISLSNTAGALKVTGNGIGSFILYPETENKFFQEYSEIRYEFIEIEDLNSHIIKLNKTIAGRVISNAKKVE